jgi:hypothetical protein
MALAQVAGGDRFGQTAMLEIRDAKYWEKSPSFREGEHPVCALKAGEWRNSAVFRVWHGSCKVSCVPGMVPRDSEKHQGDYPMFALDASNRLFAAAFSVVISAAFLAYAIVPASPSLMA